MTRALPIVLLIAGSALAQTPDPALDRVAEQLESEPDGPDVRATQTPRSDPVRPGDPGRVVLPGVTPGRLLPEGTFVGRQSGVILSAPSGELFMVFGGDPETALEPMVLLPCRTLAQMAQFVGAEDAPVLMVGGEVTTYRGRNYLLPTAFGARPIAEADEVEPAPPPPSDDPLGADPRVEELLTDILTRDRVPRGLVPAEGGAEEKGLREGELLVRRRGRLSRLSGGEWAFVFDNDHDAGDAPLVLLPCQMMQRVENIGAGVGDERSIELSGRIYTYQGRRYVLPTLFRVLPPSDLDPLG